MILNNMYEEVATEFESFSEALSEVEDDDIKRVVNLIAGLKVTQDNLEIDMFRQMDLEVGLAWMVSKFEFCVATTEAEAKRYRGQIAVMGQTTDGKADPQWRVDAKTEIDPQYKMISLQLDQYRRIFSFLDKLYRSLQRRSVIMNDLCRRDRALAGQNAQ